MNRLFGIYDKCEEEKMAWELNKVKIGTKTVYICNDCVDNEKTDPKSEVTIVDER